MTQNFNFKRREANRKIETYSTFSEAFNCEPTSPMKCLFITPHDEDTLIGAGLLLRAAVQSGIKVKLLVTCDASQRYSNINNQNDIGEIKRKEAILSYFSLGIKDIEFLNFPDMNLQYFVGRIEACDDDISIIKDHSGLQNSYTYYIRQFNPNLIFVSNPLDSYPDHRTVFDEVMSSVVQSATDIWPELGEPLKKLPRIIEFPVNRNLAEPPDIKLESNETEKNKKIEALRYFKSQTPLRPFIQNIVAHPPEEYFRCLDHHFFEPAKYRALFD